MPRPQLVRQQQPPSGTTREAWDSVATQLMARFRDSGTQDDFEALYSYTQRDVLVWLYSLLRQGSAQLDAHELLQDTFVNVFRYPHAFREDGPASFRVWVRTIAGNVVRRARTRLATRASTSLPDAAFEVADTAAGPEREADLSEQAREFDRTWAVFLRVYLEAWSGLVVRDRRALELVEVQGLDYARAAGELEVRAPNMKMIVFRSRQRLARRMRELFEAASAGASDALPGALPTLPGCNSPRSARTAALPSIG
jgi:RNA polymerase sigma factor (sigma-70 family)